MLRARELVDISQDIGTRRQRRRRRLIRVAIPVGCLVLMIVSLAFIAVYAYQNNRHDALELTDDLLETLDRRIAAEVRNYLGPASDTVQLLANIIRDPSIGITDRSQIEPFVIQILKTYPQLTIFSIADVKGNFIMPKKMPDGSIHTKIIDLTDRTRKVKWVRRDTSGRAVAEEEVAGDTYDARTRPWYVGATEARGLFWTDVYIFFTDQQPGVTAAMPVYDDDDKLLGVLGADIELSELSSFFSSLTIGRNGLALIFDQQGGLVAYPQVERMLKRVDDTFQPAMLEELGDPVLNRAYNRFKIEGHGSRILTVDNRRYLNSISSLRNTVGRDWSVMIVVPEDDFIGSVKATFSKALLMTSVIVGLASIMAGLLVFQGIRADRDAGEILSRKQEVEAQSRAFEQLASDVAVFDPNDRDSIGRLTEMVSEAASVRRASCWQMDADGTRLNCLDCYDNESKGHSRGTVFSRNDFPGLFEYMQNQAEIVISDSDEADQLAELQQVYLQPMGCRALLAVPVVHAGQTVGSLWLEHEGESRRWDVEEIAFAKAIAGLLALRFSGVKNRPLQSTDPAAGIERLADGAGQLSQPDQSVESAETVPQTPISRRGQDRIAIPSSSVALADLTRDRGYDASMLEADVYNDVAVLVLRFVDPLSLAHSIDEDQSHLAVGKLVCYFEEIVDTHDIDYWNMAGEQIVCATGFRKGQTDHGSIMADIALSLQDHCTHLFADLDKRMAFRIGIDRGAVIGSRLGRRRQFYNIWGDAVEAAITMADTGMTGGIHVGEAAYRSLRQSFVFRVRGNFYLKNFGEISTYMLTGRI
jgi:class 3 adenylate cyclase